jgi:LytS/YehU family sensor histidine kinase
MNPHFIFNALNSIQNLIIQKQVNESNLYLGKFAELLRSVLNYSSKDRISLKDEINLLKIYLDLEKLRLSDKVHTEIIIEEEEILSLMIPPFVLQPYVENAIKHGLLHSEKKEKKLKITFRREDKHLMCRIQDNGIGREASSKINLRRKKYYESFATKAIEKRINLINVSLSSPILIKIKDNIDGTVVEVRFPLQILS